MGTPDADKTTNTDLADHPDILEGNARDICRAVITKHWKMNDDASCIVLKDGS